MSLRGEKCLPLYAVCAFAAGCVVTPSTPTTETPVIIAPPTAPTPATSVNLEQRHRERAQAYEAERNWADALVQWELLTLLKPESQDYRNAAASARKRIQEASAGLARAAEFARKQGNHDQATLLYLKLLNLDRDNAAAAQALREIEVERNQRAYFNRPPRGSM